MTNKVFAIGLKGWVELRHSKKPPTPKVSKATKEIERRVPFHAFVDNRWTVRYITNKRPMILEQTYYAGGRPFAWIPTLAFKRLSKLSIKSDSMVEVPKERVESVLKYLRQKGEL